MTRVTLAFALALLCQVQPTAQEEIFILNLSFPAEIAEWLEQESARLEKLCPTRDCWARELQRKSWVLNRVYSSPDLTARHVGNVVARSADTSGWPHVRFDYRPLRGSQTVWLSAEEIGDWGYGIYVFVRAKGEPSQGDHPVWIQLGGVPGSAWIQLKPVAVGEKSLTGELSSLVGDVLQVDRVIRATNRRTGEGVILRAETHYVAERVTKDQLFLRREVGADMPCGGDEDEKDVATPATSRYRVPIASLFGSDGKPLLSYAYPRGC